MDLASSREVARRRCLPDSDAVSAVVPSAERKQSIEGNAPAIALRLDESAQSQDTQNAVIEDEAPCPFFDTLKRDPFRIGHVERAVWLDGLSFHAPPSVVGFTNDGRRFSYAARTVDIDAACFGSIITARAFSVGGSETTYCPCSSAFWQTVQHRTPSNRLLQPQQLTCVALGSFRACRRADRAGIA